MLKNDTELYGQLNADMFPIKSLYFESGSKHLVRGENYSGLYGKFLIVK